MVSDAEVRKALENFLELSMSLTGIKDPSLQVKHMGWVKGRENLKYGWYLQVQNFESLSRAKKEMTSSAFRQTFRSMYFKDQQTHVLEVVQWKPICQESRGSVDVTQQLLFGPAELITTAFETMLCSALLVAESDRQSF